MATNASNSTRASRSGEKEKILLTPEGYEDKKARLAFLLERRKSIADFIHEAKEAGDVSESSAYEEAKNLQAFNEGEIREIQHILENAELLEAPTAVDGQQIVRLGSTVDVENDRGTKRSFMIVNPVEADPSHNKISDQAPVGKALLGHATGDRVEVKTDNGVVTYTIRSIH
jgi:transcription elongation factor GreA